MHPSIHTLSRLLKMPLHLWRFLAVLHKKHLAQGVFTYVLRLFSVQSLMHGRYYFNVYTIWPKHSITRTVHLVTDSSGC